MGHEGQDKQTGHGGNEMGLGVGGFSKAPRSFAAVRAVSHNTSWHSVLLANVRCSWLTVAPFASTSVTSASFPPVGERRRRTARRRSVSRANTSRTTQLATSVRNVVSSLQFLGAWVASKSSRVGAMAGASLANAVRPSKPRQTTTVTKKINTVDDLFVNPLGSYPVHA